MVVHDGRHHPDTTVMHFPTMLVPVDACWETIEVAAKANVDTTRLGQVNNHCSRATILSYINKEHSRERLHNHALDFRPCAHKQLHTHAAPVEKMTAVGFEPTPLRTGALSQRLRPLGQTVLINSLLKQSVFHFQQNNDGVYCSLFSRKRIHEWKVCVVWRITCLWHNHWIRDIEITL